MAKRTREELIEGINDMIELAKKHHIKHYVIFCSVEDFPEVNAVCESDFPHIRVMKSRAIAKGKMYLWDGMDED